MMKKFIKVIAVMTIVALMGASIVGCSKKNNTATTAPAAQTTAKAAGGTLTVGTNAEFPPFESMESGKVVGIDIDIMQAVANKLNMKCNVVNMKFESLPNALANGQIDCIAAGYSKTPDREESMDFTSSYYTNSQAIIVKKDSTVKTINDIKNKKIGVQAGTTGDGDAKNITKNVVRLDSGALAVQDLKAGKIDAVIIDEQTATEYVDQNSDLKMIKDQFDKEAYCIAVKKGNTALQQKIDNALKEIKSDGTFQKIVDKYTK